VSSFEFGQTHCFGLPAANQMGINPSGSEHRAYFIRGSVAPPAQSGV
jgi:hypothetical protein